MHRDGVDYVLVLLVNRRNIVSGTTGDSRRRPAPSSAASPDRAARCRARGRCAGEPRGDARAGLDESAPAYRDVLVVTFKAVQAVDRVVQACGPAADPSMSDRIEIYDTTLRDGSQGHGISFSVADKLRIAERLDAFGVHYIEGGWPGSNPKDIEFFDEAKRRTFRHARLAAFGSTRRKGVAAGDDDRCGCSSTPQRRSSRSSARPRCCTSAKCCRPRPKKTWR